MTVITEKQLEKLLPGNDKIAEWTKALNTVLPKYGITSVERVAAFIAQTAHESGNYRRLVENLNYSAAGLAKTWPSRFALRDMRGNILKPYRPNELATRIERKPQEIANITYANRMGNGDERSGDGWEYRGRGLIQLTGKDNYSRFANAIGMKIADAVEYAGTFEGAIESACWFWKVNNLNVHADKKAMVSLTKAINGGTHGLDDRQARYNTAINVMKA